MNPRNVIFVLGAATLLALTGCGGSSSGGPQGSPPVTNPPPPSHSHPPVTASPTQPATSPTPTATATMTSQPVASHCLSSHLSLSLGNAQGAAGSSYVPVVLTNTGSAKCTLYGYPGVSFVDASGTQLGVPAKHSPGTEKTIKLSSGASANATLRMPNPGNFDPSTCNQATADRLRVFPPGETHPLFIKDAAQICTTKAGRTDIGPMTFGTGA